MVCVGESVSPGAPVGLPALKGPVVLHSLCLSRGGEVERVGSCTVPPQPPRFLGEEFWRVLLSGSKYRWGKESFHKMGGVTCGSACSSPPQSLLASGLSLETKEKRASS